MSAIEDWTNAQLRMMNGNQLMSVSSESAEDLVGACIPKAMRGEVTSRNNGVSKYCYCADVEVDVVAIAGAELGTGFDVAKANIIAALRADYGAASDTEAIRRCVALIGELLYHGLMPGGK
jgi:hypothetical protein